MIATSSNSRLLLLRAGHRPIVAARLLSINGAVYAMLRQQWFGDSRCGFWSRIRASRVSLKSRVRDNVGVGGYLEHQRGSDGEACYQWIPGHAYRALAADEERIAV